MEEKYLHKYSTRVDELLIVMADLEERIRVEQLAREQLTKKYEASLNIGVNQFNQETEILYADHPLVKDISLIVAQKLLQNANGNENLQTLLRQSSLNSNLMEQVFATPRDN